jgi:uncharacterized protein YkwD
MIRALIAILFTTMFAPSAFADIADVVNSVRADGCGRYRGGAAPLREQRHLSGAAKRLSRGDSLERALVNSGYRAKHSASLNIGGDTGDAAISNTIRSQFCAPVMERTFRDIGIYEHGGEVWMIVAEPFSTPANKDASKISQRVLDLANAARARGGRCGSTAYEPAGPLVENELLTKASLAYSRELASRGTLDHEGRDGSSPADRAARAGYQWRVVGENLASGPVTAEEVMKGWLASPHHCSNILDPRFTEMGVAFYVDKKSASVIYWTQMFGLPR